MNSYVTDDSLDRLSETLLKHMPPELRDAIVDAQRAETGFTGYNPFGGMDPNYGWLRRGYVRDAINHLNGSHQ